MAMVSRILHYILSLGIALTAVPAFAEGPLDPFEDQDEIPGVGVFTFKLKIPGEPIIAPGVFEVSVFCPGDNEGQVVAKVNMCKFMNYEVERRFKILKLNFKTGVVDRGGRVHCDSTQERVFNFAQSCKRRIRVQ